MACESHECHNSDPLSSTPPQASPSASPYPQRNPKEHDQCFMCKGLGHWSKDCPNKTPPKSLALRPGSSSSPSVQVPDLPVNHGGCKFFQWADSEGNNMQNMQGDKNKGYPPRRSLFTGNNELSKEDNRSSDIELESTMVESVENYPNSSMDSAVRKDEALVRDLVMQDSEPWDLVSGTELQVPPLIPKPEIPCQEPELSLQISNARHTKSEGTSPFDPVIEDVGDIEGLALLAGSPSNDDESDIKQGPFLQSPREDAEHPNGIFQEPSRMQTVVENSDTSKLALKTFGQGLLDILQSMDQTQHETMLKVAENTFDTLRHLSIDHASFSKAVREYIQCKSKLAGIEESMGKDFSKEEFLGQYNDKKSLFDNISQRHAEAVSAYEASKNQVQALRVELSRVENATSFGIFMPLQLEKHLSFYEDETSRWKSDVSEISNHKSESERSLDAACEKMEQALKLEDERDSMVYATNAALENARAQLLQCHHETFDLFLYLAAKCVERPNQSLNRLIIVGTITEANAATRCGPFVPPNYGYGKLGLENSGQPFIQNHGGCKFFQWADSEGNNMQNMQGDESKGYPLRRSLFTGNNELCKEDNRSSDIELESTMVESVENYPNSSMDSAVRKDEALVRDLVMQDSESWDLVSGTELQVPPLIPKPEIP
ncbi:hypothetical protein D5086_018444 [Populus alba]|uniref:Uncharacterized protein n=1 Tax=Populus alba TaxID=43335 RepID=A0ACC4BQ32_POPAL